MNVLLAFIILLFCNLPAYANSTCNSAKPGQEMAIEVAKKQCEEIKQSARCQELYQKIQEAGHAVEEKALRCEIDSTLTTQEKFAVSYIACLRGGIYEGIIGPIKELGRLLGETTAKAVISLKSDIERQKYCDQNPEMKPRLYATYNKSVPSLLAIPVPSNLNQKSCAEIERDIYLESNRIQRNVGNRLDPKYFNLKTRDKLTKEEIEYLEWKFNPQKGLAESNQDQGLSDYADQLLEAYQIRSDCYNYETRVALKCEILFHVATLGFGVTKTSLAKLSGLKIERFTQTVKAVTSESGALRQANEAQKSRFLLQAGGLNDSERLEASEILLGRQLTSEQKEAILAAHKVGTGKGSRSYSQIELRQKAQLLKNAGLTSQEREILMRAGITGDFDDYVKVANQAEQLEKQSLTRLTQIEAQEAKLRAELQHPNLSLSRKSEIDSELKKLESEISSIREQKLFSAISPGLGPVDLARIQRRINFTSREIEIAKANDRDLTPLVEKRAKILKESAEFYAVGKSYSKAIKEYERAVDDIKAAFQSGGLTEFQDQISALRSIELAGVEKHRDLYSQILNQVARSPQVTNQTVDLKNLSFPDASINPLVRQQQKGSTWELVRQYREQSIRIELQKTRNEITASSSLVTNPRLERDFNAMIEKRNQIKSAIQNQLKKEYGTTNPNQIQKTLKELGLD
jgi:hypothetical protein